MTGPALRTTTVAVLAVAMLPLYALTAYLLLWRLPVVTAGWLAAAASTAAAAACLTVAWRRRHVRPGHRWGGWPLAAVGLLTAGLAIVTRLP